MPSSPTFPTVFSTLPEHCEPSTPFLAHVSSNLHTCVPTPLALFSTILGTFSIISWLFAQLPQIYKNYSLESASGLSIYFLIEWCLGDSTNLVGAILTRQASWQVVVAGYYVCVDFILVVQWFWYTRYKSRRIRGDEWGYTIIHAGDGDSGIEQVPVRTMSADRNNNSTASKANERNSGDKQNRGMTTAPRDVLRRPNYASSPPSKESFTPSSSKSTSRTVHRIHSSPTPGPSPKTLLLVALLITLASANSSTPTTGNPTSQSITSGSPAEIAGRILSWASTLFYLCSRLPQLYKNYDRQSTSGVSPALFLAAFCGNLFYSCSLLANPCAWYDFHSYGGGGWVGEDGSQRLEWVGLAAPFFLGAAGVLGLDAAVGLQFMMYGEVNKAAPIVKAQDERGRSRWRRVSGWMRGWVPSVSPSREAVEVIGEQELLIEERRDSNYGAV
ncbi:MAG: hypothetical protein M1812_005466 [Candelaria pacifica]|nr:MAG: hypothetical protein M1812_005466 [Candelaria pacifica]